MAAPPVPSPAVLAKREVLQLVEAYCAAYEKRNLQSMRNVFRKGDLTAIPKLLRDEQELRCAATPPEFEALNPNVPGSARLHFTMTHVASRKSQPDTTVRRIVMEVSRPEFASPWLIDHITLADSSPR